MRLPYQFNEVGDPKDSTYGMNATQMLAEFVHSKRVRYSGFRETRGIEEQLEILVGAVGGLAESLISKGRMSPQEFIEVIGGKYDYEVRENNHDQARR